MVKRADPEGRVIAWYSAGATSTLAAKFALEQFGPDRVEVVYCDTSASEHPDNERFTRDVERWLGVPIIRLRHPVYRTHWDVITALRFFGNSRGAPCTGELKKSLRHDYQRPGDLHIFGFHHHERTRANRFTHINFDVALSFPLIERRVTSIGAQRRLKRAGLKLPALYALGYSHNNCLGCVKGGWRYWAAIRRDFPEVFDRASALERQLGQTVLCDPRTRQPLPLAAIDSARRGDGAGPPIDCGPLCAG